MNQSGRLVPFSSSVTTNCAISTEPFLIVAALTSPTGDIDVRFPLPRAPILKGFELHTQYWIHDRTTTNPWHIAMSNGLVTTIGGRRFFRFTGPNGNASVITYVPETRMDEWEFDLNDFIQDAVSVGVVSSSMYLQGVQAGFELADAGAGLTIEEFCVDIT